MGTLKLQSNRPLYSNMVIGTLAVDGWAVTFGTARRGLGGLRPRPVPSSLYHIWQPMYQLHINRCVAVIVSRLFFIRFWYLRCCGCPWNRGRQHLATPLKTCQNIEAGFLAGWLLCLSPNSDVTASETPPFPGLNGLFVHVYSRLSWVLQQVSVGKVWRLLELGHWPVTRHFAYDHSLE